MPFTMGFFTWYHRQNAHVTSYLMMKESTTVSQLRPSTLQGS
jgi:hypothetical protein